MSASPGAGKKGLLLLAGAQGLYLSNNVLLFAINGLLGLELAPKPWLATLPLMLYLAGGAVSAPWVARHHRVLGRRKAFLIGLAVAAGAALVATGAAIARDFALLLVSSAIGGYANANGSLYRFASAEIVGPALKEKAISWVLAGGIAGGVIGPNLANWTRQMGPWPYAVSYLSLVGLAILGALAIWNIDFPPPLPPATKASGAPRGPRSAAFVIAIVLGAMSNGMMNLLMAATPIAMKQCHHPFSATTVVLESHVVAMFLPSFLTGSIIQRVGAVPVLWTGLAIYLVCAILALSGTELMHFLSAMIALGVGWNFLFVGATTLFTTTYRPDEKNTAQGTMDFFVYLTLVVTSFSSGALVTSGGWAWMNKASFAPLAVMAASLAWLSLSGARKPADTAAPSAEAAA